MLVGPLQGLSVCPPCVRATVPRGPFLVRVHWPLSAIEQFVSRKGPKDLSLRFYYDECVYTTVLPGKLQQENPALWYTHNNAAAVVTCHTKEATIPTTQAT